MKLRISIFLALLFLIFGIAQAQTEEVVLARGDSRRTGNYPVTGLPEFHEVAWEANIDLASLGSPTLYDGVLYMGNQRGFLSAIDTEAGEILWRKRLAGEIGSVSFADGILYAGGMNYFAIDPETSRTL